MGWKRDIVYCFVGVGVNVILLISMVHHVMDMVNNQPLWIFSGSHKPLIDVFTLTLLSNVINISLIVAFLWLRNNTWSRCHGNHCFPRAILQVLIVMVVIGNVVSIRMALALKHSHMTYLTSHMTKAFISRIGVSSTVHYVETKFRCCGVNGPEDYSNISPVPNSCCVLVQNPILLKYDWFLPLDLDAVDWDRCKRQEPDFVHERGCLTYVSKWMKEKVDFLIFYNTCGVLILLTGVSMVIGVLRRCFDLLTWFLTNSKQILLAIVYWDIIEDMDRVYYDKCPVVLQIL